MKRKIAILILCFLVARCDDIPDEKIIYGTVFNGNVVTSQSVLYIYEENNMSIKTIISLIPESEYIPNSFYRAELHMNKIPVIYFENGEIEYEFNSAANQECDIYFLDESRQIISIIPDTIYLNYHEFGYL